VFLNGCTIALDARENTMDAAGSLIELWRGANLSENARLGAFNCDPLGVLAATGTLYYPADRACEIAAKLAADCRTMTHVTALLADGRPYHEAGASEAQELAAVLATLVAYLRACEAQGLRPRMALGKIALEPGGRCRPVPDDGQTARGARSRRPRRGRLRGSERRQRHAPDRHHQRAHAGPA
jgi:methylmalonyl-CoA mutase